MAKIDFALSEDGDLILGAPKVDNNDKTLYYHADGSTSIEPFSKGIEGKLVREMAYKLGRDAWRQVIFNRLKTDAPDWYHHPQMGGNLTDLLGESNTKNTGLLGAQYITNALTYGGFLSTTQVSVRPVPINAEEIMFFISIDIDDTEPYRLPIVFNLNSGLKEV